MPSLKRCRKCNREKDAAEFYRRASSSDGLDGDCKECHLARAHSYYERTRGDRKRQIKRLPSGACGRCGSFERVGKYDCRPCNRLRVKLVQLAQYGITPERYDAMLAAQDGGCAICGSKDPQGGTRMKWFAVDHCHSTGRVRGLLCHRCNPGLGFFADNVDLLQKAQEYLKAGGAVKYLDNQFSVALGSKAYRDNWDAIFAKKCSTCGEPYDKGATTSCSNSFHCCRDCVWQDGRVIETCNDHSPRNV